jgi:predicted acyl esterase
MWFDRWVKGIHNGIDRLPNYNLHPAGANGWVAQSASMPIRGSTMTPFYLDNAARGTVADMGTLSTRRPKAVGRDALLCAACGQGSVGAPSDALSLRYQTAPFAKDTALAGIVEGTVWATFDRDDGALSVNLLDVAPDGTATHIVDAQIRARDRVVDPRQSVYGAHGLLLDPYHPLTVAARRVVHGVDAYHLTFTPAARVIKKGHRIQARVAFTDPKFELPAPLLASLSGATMLVVHGGIQASELTLPILTGPSVEKRASFDRGRAPIDRQR